MYKTITESDFNQAFRSHGRETQFSSEAQSLLFECLESLEADTGEEIELDVIAICCDYAESEFADYASDYNVDIEDMDDDEIQEAVTDHANDNTTVVGVTDTSIVYVQF